ncbi:MAG: AhpC/TSA family protein [Kordiimonadales bacterium]|nr:MAG: AhpC/TSA family protein [Kordiimonadales bacterium]
MTKYLFLLLILITGFTTANAVPADLGPAIGSAVASEIEARDQNGIEKNFAAITGKKGTVLVFFRSAKWCPYCQVQLKKLEKTATHEITARGYNLVGISYDSPETLNKFSKKQGISFPLLSDEGSKIIKSFDILNNELKPGHGAYGIPYPIIIITDESGKVTAKLFEEGYKKRPETEVILTTLDGLS